MTPRNNLWALRVRWIQPPAQSNLGSTFSLSTAKPPNEYDGVAVCVVTRVGKHFDIGIIDDVEWAIEMTRGKP